MFRVLAGGGPTHHRLHAQDDGRAGVRPDARAARRRAAGQPDEAAGVPPGHPLRDAGDPRPERARRAGRRTVRASADRPMTAAERAQRERAYGQLREFVERSRKGLPASTRSRGSARAAGSRRSDWGSSHEARDPRAPPRLPRSAGPARPRRGRRRLHPLAAAPALPIRRGRAQPRLRRAPERPGRDARPGADRARGGHAGRRRRRGRAPRGPGARHGSTSTASTTDLVRRDATVLLRPRTGLKDMFLALDPGSRSEPAVPEGGTVRVDNTLPDVNSDEILAVLDADTRAYLKLLIGGAGKGLRGRSRRPARGVPQARPAPPRPGRDQPRGRRSAAATSRA